MLRLYSIILKNKLPLPLRERVGERGHSAKMGEKCFAPTIFQFPSIGGVPRSGGVESSRLRRSMLRLYSRRIYFPLSNQNVFIVPFPLMEISPRGMSENSGFVSIDLANCSLMWIRPASELDSIREAMFTASPQRS